MHARSKTGRRLIVAAILFSSVVQLVSAATQNAPKERDISSQMAVVSDRSSQAVMTAVTKAKGRLISVGERGIVLLSDDNGMSWRQAKSVPTSVTLTSVHFSSDLVGWAAGHSGIVLKTIDGGETWTKILDGLRAAEIELNLANLDTSNTTAQTKRQRDAQALVDDGADKPFLDIHFFDDNNGIVVGAYGLIFATTDGGANWQSLIGKTQDSKSRHLYKISRSGQNILITGEQGTALHSGNLGKSFDLLKVPYQGTLFGALQDRHGGLVVFGLRGNAFMTTDHGATWKRVDFGQPVTLTAGIELEDGGLVIVDQAGRAQISTDSGSTFNDIHLEKINSATGVAETADHGLVISTQRGNIRIKPEQLLKDVKK